MNHWLSPFAYLLGGMTLKWVLDIFFLRHVYRDNEHKLNVREAEYTALKHEHSQALTDLKNKLTELDATSKSKALAEGNLSKINSNLVALRTHVLRVEEDLAHGRNREAELEEKVARRDNELQFAQAQVRSLESEAAEQRSAAETWRLNLAEVRAAADTLADSEAGLRNQLSETLQDLADRLIRIGELEITEDKLRGRVATLEAAVASRDAQIGDSTNRFATLEAERESVATNLKLADRELGIVRAQLESAERVITEGQHALSERAAKITVLESLLIERTNACQQAENQSATQAADRDRAEQAAALFRQQAETASTEHRRLVEELAEVKRAQTEAPPPNAAGATTVLEEKLAEQSRRVEALETERQNLRTQLESAREEIRQATVAPAPDPVWLHRISDIEAELAAVSESHGLLEGELVRERQRSAGLEVQLKAAGDAVPAAMAATLNAPAEVGAPPAGLLAEIDELNRERNALAAELAALKSVQPPVTTAGSRKRKGRPAEVELFPETPSVAAPVATEEGETTAGTTTEFSAKCPQHLSDVTGIGSVFEQRLYMAGVGSYWELAQLTDRTLAEVLELDLAQREQFDFAATRADATRLARETQSEGRKWSGDEPDDLEPLEGIGAAVEKRLYNAGICTFGALAAASEELLAEICPPTKFRGANYARWIEQARQRIAREED